MLFFLVAAIAVLENVANAIQATSIAIIFPGLLIILPPKFPDSNLVCEMTDDL
jgi:hypothetical protein